MESIYPESCGGRRARDSAGERASGEEVEGASGFGVHSTTQAEGLVIEGLKFQMAAAELREHLMARIDHHTERAGWYQQKSDELVAGGVTSANMTNGDPVGAMRAKQRQHEQSVKLFSFMRDHVADGETYQLADADLQRIEILERGW